ncbi:MAG: hypothetical protein A2050_11850 [Candidatus Rokubacteria bacterium GWA2_73_35]|nr:MAG: hypothetical protein A2050_11850 [Candidatus Rokubacteria bacterium GWA2_73_35]
MKRRAGRSRTPADPGGPAPGPPRVESHLGILHRVAETVSRTLDVDDVLRTAVEALTQVTGHEIASLHLLSEDGTMLQLRGDRGMSEPLREVNRALPVGQGLIGRVAATGKTLQLEKNYEDPDILPAARATVRREQIRGFVCVPIHCRGRILGTLSLGRKTLERFDADEVALVEAAADQIGIALDNARLYSETRRQLDELKRAQEQLIRAEKLSAVGELASGVAHEINNPLTTILGQTHLLLGHPEVTPHVRERLGIVSDEATRAARIVQNLLLFARHYTPERRPCSLADQARRVLELKDYQLKQDGIQVVTDFAHCPAVLADDNQLQQVLLNLVQNAHQAMIRQTPPRVLTVRVWAADGRGCVEVRDTGPGIPPEALPRIFDPFFTTKPPGEGSGLGLSVSYGLITELGGRLRAGNHPEGGGATFVIDLPLAEAAA